MDEKEEISEGVIVNLRVQFASVLISTHVFYIKVALAFLLRK